jgi:protein-S-isoprenylcysteine O-methyltransferase Ste14
MITALGVGIFILATIFMKSSWRVGIDKNTKTTLVTDGIYKFSRNPAFVGFYLMFIGLFVTYANIFTLIVLVINILTFHLLILQEEKHLLSMFGVEYERYKRKVPRYFLIF